MDERKCFHIVVGMRNLYLRSREKCVTILSIQSGAVNAILECPAEMGTCYKKKKKEEANRNTLFSDNMENFL